MTVSLVRFDGSLDSIGRAIDLCGGLDRLSRSDRVLIKPNITFSGWIPIPPFGVVTTSIVIEGILRRLADHGCRDITIGEGSVAEVLGSNTRRGFRYAGIDRAARKYGAKLVDFNEGPFESTLLGNVRAGISRHVLDSDFLINVPVLKTHRQTRVSLGFKNLKGCLNVASRKRFHHKGLDHMIFLLNQRLKCDLTVIDGIYMLEKGADTLMGTAYRKDTIVAGCDTFECDCVGAEIMGIPPRDVAHLREYAEAEGRSLDTGNLRIAGEDIASIREKLEWEFDARDELLPFGISGLSVPFPGDSLCSGCYGNLVCALGMFAKASPNRDFGDTRIYWGRKRAEGTAGTNIILFGDCGISSNRHIEPAVRIAGCPPSMPRTLSKLMFALLPGHSVAGILLLHSPQLLALRAGLYSGNLPKWKRYEAPEYDRGHFRQPRLERVAASLLRRR